MENNKIITHGRTSVYNVNYHIVWCTKYRNKVLQGNVEVILKRELLNIANDKGFSIEHLEVGKKDHVHLLVSAPPKLSITKIVSWLKGISALRLLRTCSELRSSYWKQKRNRHLWSNSYYVETIGATNSDAIAKYIDDQKKK